MVIAIYAISHIRIYASVAIFCVYSFPTLKLFQKAAYKDNYPFLSIVVT